MIWTDDPVMDAANYEAERAAKMEELPICDCCGNRITDDYYWEFARDVYCEACAEKLFRKLTPEV